MKLLRGLTEREARLCIGVSQWAPDSCRSTLAIVSRLGDGIFWYALILLIALTQGAEGRLVATKMLAVGGITLVIYRSLKAHVARPRPAEVLSGIKLGGRVLDRWSFPSGHTMHAVAFSFTACAAFPSLGIILVPATTLVMISRVVLGLHYPSDVLAGALLGWLTAGTMHSLLS